MTRYGYERLGDRNADYLARETPNALAHAASIEIFEAGPLRTAEGGVDFAAIRGGIAWWWMHPAPAGLGQQCLLHSLAVLTKSRPLTRHRRCLAQARDANGSLVP